MVAEFGAGSGKVQGLAWQMLDAGNKLQTARMIAALVVLGAMGVALHALLEAVERAGPEVVARAASLLAPPARTGLSANRTGTRTLAPTVGMPSALIRATWNFGRQRQDGLAEALARRLLAVDRAAAERPARLDVADQGHAHVVGPALGLGHGRLHLGDAGQRGPLRAS